MSLISVLNTRLCKRDVDRPIQLDKVVAHPTRSTGSWLAFSSGSLQSFTRNVRLSLGVFALKFIVCLLSKAKSS